jgi:hypothetical protein
VSVDGTDRSKLAAIRQAVSAGVLTEDEANIKRGKLGLRISDSYLTNIAPAPICGLDRTLEVATAQIQEALRERGSA